MVFVLLLCVWGAVGLNWVKSYYWTNTLWYGGSAFSSPLMIYDWRGEVVIEWFTASLYQVIRHPWQHPIGLTEGITITRYDAESVDGWRDKTWSSRLGLRTFTHRDLSGVVIGKKVAVPHWFMFALISVALWIAHRPSRQARMHRYRAEHGLCLACGYDLRAHHPGQKCPECGTEVPAGAGAAAGKAGAG
jgi:hypothetical protein